MNPSNLGALMTGEYTNQVLHHFDTSSAGKGREREIRYRAVLNDLCHESNEASRCEMIC